MSETELDPFARARGRDDEPESDEAAAPGLSEGDPVVALAARYRALVEEANRARDTAEAIELEANRALPAPSVQLGFKWVGCQREPIVAYCEDEIVRQFNGAEATFAALWGELSPEAQVFRAKRDALIEDLRRQIAEREAELEKMRLPAAERRADQLDDAVAEIERQIATTRATSIEGLDAQLSVLAYDVSPGYEPLLDLIRAGLRGLAR